MSDHFEPKLYVAVGRAGGKVYESQRLMYDLLVNGYELKPMNVKKENNMNDIEFTNLHVKNILNGVIGAKPPKQPVMSKPVQHMVVKEPEIVLKSSWDGDDVNGVMATFRKDIYAKVVDTTDKAIVDAIIDFARSEGFTDAYLIDKAYIKDALENKEDRDKLERDLEDAEERNNVKDARINELKAQIEVQAETISKKRAEINKLYDDIHEIAEERDSVIKKNATLVERIGELEKGNSRLKTQNNLFDCQLKFEKLAYQVCKKENEQLKDELKRHNNVNFKLDLNIEQLKAENAELHEKIDEMENLIGRYEVMKQTLEMVFGDVIVI